MSKKENKFYVCLHETCTFKTDKRKAIYTHLIRTHSERKEDYECEYCSTIFHRESDVEDHLQQQHPSQPFTYTCVSRIENVINKCAKLGAESRRQSVKLTGSSSDITKSSPKINIDPDEQKPLESSVGLKQRTKASVNESLNKIAKSVPKLMESYVDDGPASGEDDYIDDAEEDLSTIISKPNGLKIKLNLKKIAECSSREASSERSNSPPYLEPNDTKPEEDDSEYSDVMPTLPTNVESQNTSQSVVREKASKYYDRLEVYHRTDDFGRRCCPFCDYKTTKNTIRVHLSGIHKIHFVKCSLCDYKAAFPHQITQHGVKFHKTTNINVIQLSKSSRDVTISKLPKADDFYNEQFTQKPPKTYNYSYDTLIENDNSNGSFEDFGSEESYVSSEECADPKDRTYTGATDDSRVFKAPKCQTSKTDYYSIQHENGVYMYKCNLCTFQTPVRATIYTHKYRHEEKSYQCGYCDFTSAPRSNVVHHCRSRHKHDPVKVVAIGDQDDDSQSVNRTDVDVKIKEANDKDAECKVKTEPIEENHEPDQLNHQTIIKVPQFKRTFTSVATDQPLKPNNTKRQKTSSETPIDYKMSLNKLYKINPNGSPKYLCIECPYACDTHPKMKHHLYRHRPQQYKCPYCDHRKYPRSYVVRHVRDTHRDKPVRVIDLAISNEPIDIPEYMDTSNVTDESVCDDEATFDNTDLEDSMNQYINQEMQELNEKANNIQADKLKTTVDIKQEQVDQSYNSCNNTSGENNIISNKPEVKSITRSATNNSQSESPGNMSTLRKALELNTNYSPIYNDKMFLQTPDVSPNFSDAVYTSTPLIESIINGQYNSNANNSSIIPPNSQSVTTPKGNNLTKNFEKKKSLKDYRVNFGAGPRYVCNICEYGTENYKTIHNHMYRHESQRYQCPYCGYRRSPKSFVENHIREVHKGHPVIVTELNLDDMEPEIPIGSPRQCQNLKRKDDQLSPTLTPPVKKVKEEPEVPIPHAPKLPVRWPAPKPVAKSNMAIPKAPAINQHLQIPVKQRDQPASIAPNIPQSKLQQSLLKNGIPAIASNVKTSHKSQEAPTQAVSDLSASNIGETIASKSSNTNNNAVKQNPFKFKEAARTTFKTMYKCVFDPETCNHISKDKSKMKQHLFMHVEYKPWSCDFCEMTASQSSHIKNHVRTEHPEVSEMSFRYKRHNYLEKHIEGFLTKGLFTVPVNEYRVIMDMKGNTKSANRSSFNRDDEGFILCPHCDYKTKSGGMTDHVKMKHMQPRFKCHWCDYRAFYRSEIRKHHRKEKSHMDFDFKTQELDLVQVIEGYKAAKLSASGGDRDITENPIENDEPDNESIDDDIYGDDYDDDDVDDDDDDMSSNGSSSMGDYSNLEYTEYTTEQLSDLCSRKTGYVDGLEGLGYPSFDKEDEIQSLDDNAKAQIYDNHPNNDNEPLPSLINTEVGDDGFMKLVKIAKTEPGFDEDKKPGSKFRCGYCPFSAELRVKVKMHCGKKHSDKELMVIDPSHKHKEELESAETIEELKSNNVVRVNANDWKGTKFENDLKKAGVSKLNLASLFPKSKRFVETHHRAMSEADEIDNAEHDEEDDSDVDNLEENSEPTGNAAPLTIPFKKAPATSKIDIPIVGKVDDAKKLNEEPEFKKPFDPICIPKLSEKKREKSVKSMTNRTLITNGNSSLTKVTRSSSQSNETFQSDSSISYSVKETSNELFKETCKPLDVGKEMITNDQEGTDSEMKTKLGDFHEEQCGDNAQNTDSTMTVKDTKDINRKDDNTDNSSKVDEVNINNVVDDSETSAYISDKTNLDIVQLDASTKTNDVNNYSDKVNDNAKDTFNEKEDTDKDNTDTSQQEVKLITDLVKSNVHKDEMITVEAYSTGKQYTSIKQLDDCKGVSGNVKNSSIEKVVIDGCEEIVEETRDNVFEKEVPHVVDDCKKVLESKEMVETVTDIVDNKTSADEKIVPEFNCSEESKNIIAKTSIFENEQNLKVNNSSCNDKDTVKIETEINGCAAKTGLSALSGVSVKYGTGEDLITANNDADKDGLLLDVPIKSNNACVMKEIYQET